MSDIDDPTEEYGADQDIPPQYLNILESADSEICRASNDVMEALDGYASAVESELSSAQATVNVAVATALGQADSEIYAALPPINAAVEKVADQVLRELIFAEEALRSEGVSIPYDLDARRIILDDGTGDAMLTVLRGGLVTAPTQPDAGSYVNAAADEPAGGPLPSPEPLPLDPEPAPAGAVATADLPVLSEPPGGCRAMSLTDTPTGWTRNPDGSLVEPAGRVWVLTAYPDGSNTLGYYCPTDSPVSPPVSPPPASPPPVSPPPPSSPPPPPPCECPESPPVSPPPVEELPEGYRTEGKGVLWSQPDVCAQLYESTRPPKSPIDPGAEPGERLDFSIGVQDLVFPLLAPAATALDALGLTGNDGAKAQLLGKVAEIGVGYGIVQSLWNTLDPKFVPDREATAILAARLSIAETAADYAQVPMDYLMQGERYMMQYLAPQYLPSQAELNSAYLGDRITIDQWTCLTRSLGNVPECAKWSVEVSTVKPDPRTLIDFWRRGIIKTVGERDFRARQVGVLDPLYMSQLEEATRAIPQPPDLVRFMVRDALDDAVAKAYGYDTEFEEKLYGPGGRESPGKVADWMKANGVTEEQLRYYWRAHWEIPSNTALYEMLHRLRPDRKEYLDYAKAVTDWVQGGEVGPRPEEPPVATHNDVRDAILINDMAPGWVDRLMAVSYHPMTRTDAINAFMANVRDGAWLYERFRDNGYDEPTAREMVSIQEMIRARRVSNLTGVWSARKVVREYKDGTINRLRADELLVPIMPDPVQRRAVLDGADAERESAVTAASLKGLRRAMYTGFLSAEKAADNLNALGVDPARARQLVTTWDIERTTRYREPSAKMVMEWLGKGVISPAEAFARLLNLGYDKVDANVMTQRALQQQIEGQQREMMKIERAQERAIKNAAAAKKSTDKALEERMDELRAQMDAAQKEYDRIMKERGRRA